MNTELKTALEILEKEKDISKDVMLDAIENSLITACQSHFEKEKENFRVEINREDCCGAGGRSGYSDQPGRSEASG